MVTMVLFKTTKTRLKSIEDTSGKGITKGIQICFGNNL